MRYFKNRQEAGRLLAEKLIDHNKENTVVLSLSEGGVVVGAEIAKTLHSQLFLLVTEDVDLPGEPDPVATMSSSGSFTYNSNSYSTGELEALSSDYRPVIEAGRMHAFQKINRILSSDGGSIPKERLKNHVIIIVSDGIRNGLSLDVVGDFLKPIQDKSIIVATPIADVQTLDKMRLLSDEVVCLNAIDNYMNTDHYYEDNKMPEHDELIKLMQHIIFEW